MSRAAFFEPLAMLGPQRLELLVALLEILEFGGRDGGTSAEGPRHGDLTRIGFGIGDEFGNGLDPKQWVDQEDNGDACDARNAMSRMKLNSSFRAWR